MEVPGLVCKVLKLIMMGVFLLYSLKALFYSRGGNN
jgi:hypothetical protein